MTTTAPPMPLPQLYRHVWRHAAGVRAPLAWHDRHHAGDLQHRIGQASGALCHFTQNQFLYPQNAINLAGPLVALVLLSHMTATVAPAGYALIGLSILRFDISLMRLATAENHAERRYVARLLDARLLEVFAPLRRSIALNEWNGAWSTLPAPCSAGAWSSSTPGRRAAWASAAPARRWRSAASS